MTIEKQQAIGIFDSGIGGLTVAHAVAQRLPHENIIYVGDTAHLPYGDKSAETIRHYVRHIADVLLAQRCKLILIACNSATAAAYDYLTDYLQGRAELMGVIAPVVAYIAAHHADQALGLIGTRQTVDSNVFQQQLSTHMPRLNFVALATPLLVPVIEEGFHDHSPLVDAVLNAYLSDARLATIEVLILGCTHYPLIKSRVQAYYANRVQLIDASLITADAVAERLSTLDLSNDQPDLGQHSFYVSDLTPAFRAQAADFFGDTIRLQLLPEDLV